MKKMTGVVYCKGDKYAVFIINDLSDDIKESIREHLSLICHGSDYANSGRKMYGYRNTVREFIKRYETKSRDIQLGMIGELLVHFLIQNYFNEYKSVTPYFNMEERSIKKGYDVVLTEVDSPVLWITEVKSGELHKNKNSNQTMNDLVGTAKADLNQRFNEENTSLWMEAINGANISFDNNNDMKQAVMEILFGWGDEAVGGTYTSSDKNVILTGVLFADTTDSVTEENIKKKHERIENGKGFNKVYVLAVQKETYTAVYNFLKDEASDEE